jgi:hypothetical protein
MFFKLMPVTPAVTVSGPEKLYSVPVYDNVWVGDSGGPEFNGARMVGVGDAWPPTAEVVVEIPWMVP